MKGTSLFFCLCFHLFLSVNANDKDYAALFECYEKVRKEFTATELKFLNAGFAVNDGSSFMDTPSGFMNRHAKELITAPEKNKELKLLSSKYPAQKSDALTLLVHKRTGGGPLGTKKKLNEFSAPILYLFKKNGVFKIKLGRSYTPKSEELMINSSKTRGIFADYLFEVISSIKRFGFEEHEDKVKKIKSTFKVCSKNNKELSNDGELNLFSSAIHRLKVHIRDEEELVSELRSIIPKNKKK